MRELDRLRRYFEPGLIITQGKEVLAPPKAWRSCGRLSLFYQSKIRLIRGI